MRSPRRRSPGAPTPPPAERAYHIIYIYILSYDMTEYDMCAIYKYNMCVLTN